MKRICVILFLFILGDSVVWSPELTLAATSQLEMTGTIRAIRFSDPLKETNILAQVDVVDSFGKKVTVVVTLDTSIRDPQWHNAYVSYLSKQDRVKVRYEMNKYGAVAKVIHVLTK